MQAIQAASVIRHSMFILFLALIALLMKADRWASSAKVAAASQSLPALQGQPAVNYLKENGLYGRLHTAVESSRYEIQHASRSGLPQTLKTAGEIYQTTNPAQHLQAFFSAGQVVLEASPSVCNRDWQAGLKLRGVGYGERVSAAPAGSPRTNGNRIEIPRGMLTEWYVNTREGIEQGFTLRERPDAGFGTEPLRVVMTVTGELRARLEGDGQAVSLVRRDGGQALRYDHLAAYDATGRELPSRMEVNGAEIFLLVEEAAAVYPVTIDPLFTQTKKLTASDGAAGDSFGTSIGISNDTIVVGAPFKNSQTGAAYIFSRNQGGADNWGEVKILMATDAATGDRFGYAVGISGDTVVVGASFKNSTPHPGNTGEAYIFGRNQGGADNWGQVRKLSASDANLNDHFGGSVGISGDTVVVGANAHDGFVGAAYIFERNQGGAENWGEVKIIANPFPADNDNFGWAIGISGNIVVVGRPFRVHGAAYIFERNQGGADNWGLVRGLSGDNSPGSDTFGRSVSISGEMIVVGAPFKNSAYIFGRNQGGANNWGQVRKLAASDGAVNDRFGDAVGINDELVVVGATGKNSKTGAAYVFGRNLGGADNWGQIQKLTAIDGAVDDSFGFPAVISGDSVVIGGSSKNSGKGAAYIFTDQCGQWAQIRKQTASDGTEEDQFAYAVGTDGDTVVVGSYGKNFGIGAAYVFERNQGGADKWGLIKLLSPLDANVGSRFGSAIGISGQTIVVGAFGKNDYSGAAYIYRRNQGGANNWGLVKILTASDGVRFDFFGNSVGISGDKIVVGAAGKNFDTGGAYVYGQNQGGADNWGLVRALTASDGVALDSFGNSVGISDNTVIVGAPGKNNNTGAAYIFERNLDDTNNWEEVRKLILGDRTVDDSFGNAVGISNETIVIGARGKNSLAGAAYIYGRNEGGVNNWGVVQQLIAGNRGKFFGYSVSISNDKVLVGANFNNLGTGASYIFGRNQGGADNWGEVQKLVASDGMAGNIPGVPGDAFGQSVGISGNTAVAGAPGKNFATGAAYIFTTFCPPTISKAFSATNILLNGTTSLNFTINNLEAAFPVSSLAFTDLLPAGLVVAIPASVIGSCGGTVSAVAGSSTISLSGGSLSSGGSCMISVNVTGTTLGPKSNTTGPLMTSNGPVAPSNTAVLNVHDMQSSLSDPLVCTGSGSTVNVTATVTNGAATAQPTSFAANLPANLLAVLGTCAASVGTCSVANSSTVTWSDTLAAGQTVTITYRAQVADNAVAGSQVCVTSSAIVGGNPAGSVTACAAINCPPPGPGLPLATASPMTDQKAGSVLIYNIYTSGSDPMRQNTRLSITNTEPSRPAFVHLFFVDGASCSVADSFLCLTPNQTATFLASDLDPGTTGYVVAVAVDSRGCPASFNSLIGDEYVKFQSGHTANLSAQAITAIAGGLPVCDANASTAVLAFDGVSYNVVPHVLAGDNIPSRADGNDTLLILNRIGGNLGIGASTLDSLFGLFYDDAETSASFNFSPGVCQFRGSFLNSFPRITPRFEQFVPAGRSGWFKVWMPGLFGMTGALINFNSNATASAGAFNQGHNLHALTNTTNASYVIPVFPPNC